MVRPPLSRALATLALSGLVLAATTATTNAAVVGDDYRLSANNFPVAFADAGPLTFNAAGDLSAEIVPGSGGALTVIEQELAFPGPNGGLQLGFQFRFPVTSGVTPADPAAPFAFLITGLDGAGVLLGPALSALIRIDFGISLLDFTDATLLTASFESNGFNILFDTTAAGASWSDVFAASTPVASGAVEAITVTYLVELAGRADPGDPTATSEPSALAAALLGLSLLAFPVVARRAARLRARR